MLEMPHIRVVGLSVFKDEPISTAIRQPGAEVLIGKTVYSAELLLFAICGIRSGRPDPSILSLLPVLQYAHVV
jgi:hypothetical protein